MIDLKEQMNNEIDKGKEQMNNEIDKGLHREVNPQYLKKLEKIKKQKGIKFESAEEFDAYFSDKIIG